MIRIHIFIPALFFYLVLSFHDVTSTVLGAIIQEIRLRNQLRVALV